jgi:hypothetical protein
MDVCIIKEDRVVMIDGEGINFDFDLPSNVWAIQWNGLTGEIEFNDGTANQEINDFVEFQYLVDAHATEKSRLAGVATQEALDAEAAMTYSEKRKEEYDSLNQFEMQFDDQRDGTTTWVDAINAIKAKFPK